MGVYIYICTMYRYGKQWPKYFIITQSSKYDELNQKGHI